MQSWRVSNYDRIKSVISKEKSNFNHKRVHIDSIKIAQIYNTLIQIFSLRLISNIIYCNFLPNFMSASTLLLFR